ncbi:hypothetical protein [Nonomuraea sp. NPDC005501]|uniref:hypothetical protein n=1 Tax=Nonomuraea sp. NPDC005501 TaxID=3156884 RepID=UPI0033A2744B
MELPILCSRCGAHFQSGVELPAASSLFEFDPYKMPLDSIPKAKRPCPICAYINDHEPVLHTLGVLYTVRMAALRRDEQERLINKIAQLEESQCNPGQVINEILDEEPKVAGLRRLVPRGQANILAFIALLVSSVTLLENMLGDLKDLKELFDGPPENGLKMDYYPHRKLHFLSPIKCGGSATMLESNSLVAIL